MFHKYSTCIARPPCAADAAECELFRRMSLSDSSVSDSGGIRFHGGMLFFSPATSKTTILSPNYENQGIHCSGINSQFSVEKAYRFSSRPSLQIKRACFNPVMTLPCIAFHETVEMGKFFSSTLYCSISCLVHLFPLLPLQRGTR
jgi:hypothetical protein